MEIKIKELNKRDYKKAIQFAIIGMNFNWYLDSKLLINLYGRYFWYLEMNRATEVIAAYSGDNLLGVLLVAMKGEYKKYYCFWKSIYVGIFGFLQKVFFKKTSGIYEKTTKELFKKYLENNSPDGEIIFLAVDPQIKSKGIGTKLISEFESKQKGKNIYLHTDNGCTYQFYNNRGFHIDCEKDILLYSKGKKLPLKCFIYTKKIK